MSSRASSLTRRLAALAFCALLATPPGTAAFTDAVRTTAHVFTDVAIPPLVHDIRTSVTTHPTTGDTTANNTTTTPTQGGHR